MEELIPQSRKRRIKTPKHMEKMEELIGKTPVRRSPAPVFTSCRAGGARSACRSLGRNWGGEIWDGAPWEHLPGPPGGGVTIVPVRSSVHLAQAEAARGGAPVGKTPAPSASGPHRLSPVITGVYGMPPFFAPWTKKKARPSLAGPLSRETARLFTLD